MLQWLSNTRENAFDEDLESYLQSEQLQHLKNIDPNNLRRTQKTPARPAKGGKMGGADEQEGGIEGMGAYGEIDGEVNVNVVQESLEGYWLTKHVS
jgi:hypothetical protein